MLKEPGIGDVGFRVRYDSRRRPVFYVWQAFTWVRIRLSEARRLRALIDHEDKKFLARSSPTRGNGD